MIIVYHMDGKISTGDVDELDVDKDFKRIVGVKEGLQQYYDLEKQTDLFSLNTGRVMAKIGVNERTTPPKKIDCSFIILDNKPHLNEKGVAYLAQWVKTLYLVTTNKNHPAFKVKQEYSNIEILFYDGEVDLAGLMEKLKREYRVDRITIQSGGTLNAEWVRRGLIDHVSVVIAAVLVGGKDTSTLVDGESLHTQVDLLKVRPLRLVKCEVLENSYLHAYYDVVNEVRVDE